jgi:chemotaxis protein methyltransferase CheR
VGSTGGAGDDRGLVGARIVTTRIDRTQIDRFREIVTKRLGLSFDESRIDQITDALRQRAEATASRSVDAYLGTLAATVYPSAEMRALAEGLTVSETFFFRNADNFRAFCERVLPDRMRIQASAKRLRILCAGCASGEEPYSVAILLRETIPDFASWDIQIVAFDLNPVMLAKASRARYSAWSLRATSDETRRRYFREEGREFVLDPAIQRMVTFEERNLAVDDPAFWSEPRDVVFCRNVIMYFTPAVAQRVVQRFAHALDPDAYLFLGHAETLRGISNDFHLCHSHDTFYYQRRVCAPGTPVENVSFDPHQSYAYNAPVDAAASIQWIDIIQRSSDRIAELRVEPTTRTANDAGIESTPTAPTRSWDLAPVFDAMRRERFSDALELLATLPADSNNDPDAVLLRAALLTNAGRLDDAERACVKLLSIDELNAGAHYLMALCREHAGDTAAAAEHDQTALYLDPTFAMPHLHLGLAARRCGDLATARRHLGQAVALLGREDASRVLLFGGGFSRETLLQLCRAELRAAEGER